MKKLTSLLGMLLICALLPALVARGADRKDEPRVGNGYIPRRGPAPAPRTVVAPVQAQERVFRDREGHPNAPHVHAEDGRWIGHDYGRDDVRFHLDRAWEHGRFTGGFGGGRGFSLWGGGREKILFWGIALFFRGLAKLDVEKAVG